MYAYHGYSWFQKIVLSLPEEHKCSHSRTMKNQHYVSYNQFKIMKETKEHEDSRVG